MPRVASESAVSAKVSAANARGSKTSRAGTEPFAEILADAKPAAPAPRGETGRTKPTTAKAETAARARDHKPRESHPDASRQPAGDGQETPGQMPAVDASGVTGPPADPVVAPIAVTPVPDSAPVDPAILAALADTPAPGNPPAGQPLPDAAAEPAPQTPGVLAAGASGLGNALGNGDAGKLAATSAVPSDGTRAGDASPEPALHARIMPGVPLKAPAVGPKVADPAALSGAPGETHAGLPAEAEDGQPMQPAEAKAKPTGAGSMNADTDAASSAKTSAAAELRGPQAVSPATEPRAPDLQAARPPDPATAAIQSPAPPHHATQAATTSPAAPTQTPVPLGGLGVAIAANAKDGHNRFEIRLDPPELGRIDVRLRIDAAGQVTSHLIVDRAETLDLLRRDAADLERSLQQAGLKTSDNGLQFSLRDQSPGNDRDLGGHHQAARVIVSDGEPMADLAVRGYLRAGQGSGLDIRV